MMKFELNHELFTDLYIVPLINPENKNYASSSSVKHYTFLVLAYKQPHINWMVLVNKKLQIHETKRETKTKMLMVHKSIA